ncbi:isocitrate/isopropylmalate dehydrogenase family protein [Mycolicibacterium mageritense]|uniref:Homoisocitrate dehydrogenase n=1 Tax=Mycolicibacterium mageritense TaxID=53462 RepID=A0AAI8TV25_MYCME|nr:isocitrate/isopropylmalate dehydrogenase family protein [Mycolicibacterium mageritense]TXI66060.1 MAG: isocitrate/isopropylmalate dehydrogenase family protein [Mycolicibacterium mageritense]BDY29075.1 Homoisocitrate dehydrogenase [Mycolicibacterium mageritense]
MTDSTLRLGLLEGDGIGPEIVPASVAVVEAALAAAGAPAAEWVTLPLGRSAIDTHGSHIPTETLDALAGMDAWLLGPHDSAAYPEPFKSQLNPSGTIRKHFGLFANIRPAKAFEGAKAVVPGTDLVIVRENTQGFYADRNTFAGTGEYMPDENTAIAMGIITRSAVERIAKVAFDLAQARRGKLTIVHKANVLRLTTGLFRDVCREIGTGYPDVEVDDYHIDAMTVHLVRSADKFDVIVTENMFGDILSDLAGELAGSLGIAPSINASLDKAMAQAAHGSAPDIAGRDIANPIAMILSSGMLLQWLGARRDDASLIKAAALVEGGVEATVRAGTMTPDMGGSTGTREFGEAVAATIKGQA